MADLQRILVALTLVVHLTMGCCLHHAHGCEDSDPLAEAHHGAMPGGQCPESDSDHSPHGAQNCQGVKCYFILPNHTVSDSVIQPFHASFAVLLDDLFLPVGIDSGLHDQPAGRLLPPVRLHLANQVLLI